MTGLDTAIQRTLDLGTPSTLGTGATTGHPRTSIGLVAGWAFYALPTPGEPRRDPRPPPDGITVGIRGRPAP